MRKTIIARVLTALTTLAVAGTSGWPSRSAQAEPPWPKQPRKMELEKHSNPALGYSILSPKGADWAPSPGLANMESFGWALMNGQGTMLLCTVSTYPKTKTDPKSVAEATNRFETPRVRATEVTQVSPHAFLAVGRDKNDTDGHSLRLAIFQEGTVNSGSADCSLRIPGADRYLPELKAILSSFVVN